MSVLSILLRDGLALEERIVLGNRTRVGLIGAGYFAGFHADGWMRIEDADLVGIAALDGAFELAAKHDVPAFNDVRAMSENCSIDLLDIATPPSSHAELVSLAAGLGINAICQKPLAPTRDEARHIVEIAEEHGILLVAHENFRFQPWYREAKRLIDQGALGEILNITFRLRPGDGQGADAYLERQPYFREMNRFLIHETGIHLIDSFRYLMGEVTGVQARLRKVNPSIAGEDSALVTFEFENGALGLFDGNRHLDHVAENTRLTMGEMWLEGSAASLRLDGFGRLFKKPHNGPEFQHTYRFEDRAFGGDCVMKFQAHVMGHLRRGEPLENSARSYLRNLEIEEAIYQSHEEKRFIEV